MGASLAPQPLLDAGTLEDMTTGRTLEVILGGEHLETGGALHPHTRAQKSEIISLLFSLQGKEGENSIINEFVNQFNECSSIVINTASNVTLVIIVTDRASAAPEID